MAQQYLLPEKLQIVLVGDSQQYVDAIRDLGLPVENVDLQQTQ